MPEDDALTRCARAMIRRHGSNAAAMARHLADAHRAIDAAEIAEFWNAVAQEVHRLSVSRADDREASRARRWRMKAEEYRAVAAPVRNPQARASYRRLADTYDALADRREKAAEATRPKKPQAD